MMIMRERERERMREGESEREREIKREGGRKENTQTDRQVLVFPMSIHMMYSNQPNATLLLRYILPDILGKVSKYTLFLLSVIHYLLPREILCHVMSATCPLAEF